MEVNTIDLENFIKASNLKNKEMLSGIFKELISQYPEETYRQHAIRAAIMLFEQKYPEEVRLYEKSIKETKETRANEYAADYIQDIRLAFSFPSSLLSRISAVVKNPPFMSNEAQKTFGEHDWIRKNFSRYCVPSVY